MNLMTYDKLCSLLNQVPLIIDLHEKKNPSFKDEVEAWMKAVASVLKSSGTRQVAEISTLKSLISSTRRGILPSNNIAVPLGNSVFHEKRKIIDAVCVYAFHNAQHSLQEQLDMHEPKFIQARQLIRKVLLLASGSGKLNSITKKKFDPAITLPSLWKDLVSDPNIAPWTSQILQMISLEDTFTIINQILDEWIRDHENNIVNHGNSRKNEPKPPAVQQSDLESGHEALDGARGTHGKVRKEG